ARGRGSGLRDSGRGALGLAGREAPAPGRAFAGLGRYGAATLDLAWVGAGRLDAFWERDLSPWDLAAGSILVREAGGFISDLDGSDAILSKGNVVAGNETMHRELLRLLREAAKAAGTEAAAASPRAGGCELTMQRAMKKRRCRCGCAPGRRPIRISISPRDSPGGASNGAAVSYQAPASSSPKR